MKRKISLSQGLKLPNLHKPFEVEEDASNYTMEVILFKDEKLVYVKFNEPIFNYLTYDNELCTLHQAYNELYTLHQSIQ